MARLTETMTIHLHDYQVPDFNCDALFLHFELMEQHTVVNAVLHLSRNPASKNLKAPLVLNGEAMQLQRVLLDGHLLNLSDYTVDDSTLNIPNVPQKFLLETEVIIKPQENLALSGLYKSRNNYCTQCESHGFRRITYFMDRPDVMTYFTVTISADKTKYPVLLSNGNLIEEKELEHNRHWVKWHDPSLKPSYLFALVAGDFDMLQDSYKTFKGRDVDLRIYVERGNLDQSRYAMESLKNAMRWDEKTYGREYDLNIYMIVAVSDFNMGAMENKGLNIFNDKYILAKPDTATDEDYVFIESVIGHEYFHNWSGNRVTVRDWFQITLKEGLTIFRDQSFTADQTLGDVKRIQDVNVIRNVQFAQDAGPMAHPIRPQSYIEINNFYTVTVYNKGSEVIRMQQTLLGKDKFRLAMDEYFRRFDGKAVTTDDFVQVMSEVGGIDLTQFMRWYEQAGTPTLTVTDQYDAAKQTYTLNIKQQTPPTPNQPTKLPFLIPFAVGLLYREGDKRDAFATRVLTITENEQRFEFDNITSKPVPSLLRNFSAPVKVVYPYSDDELTFLMLNDSDGFNRWDAGQGLAIGLIMKLIDNYQQDRDYVSRETFVNAYRDIIRDSQLDSHLKAEMLTLPAISYIIELMTVADVEAIYVAREFIKKELASQLSTFWQDCYSQNASNGAYVFNREEMGHRRLSNIALAFLVLGGQKNLAVEHYAQADNLTDRIGALIALNESESPERDELLAAFYERYQKNNLVLDKWFRIQAMAPLPSTLARVKKLMSHPAFDLKNPNKVRALIGSFSAANPICFHAVDGSGYAFLTEQVFAIDAFNPQTAARMVEPLSRWRKFDEKRQNLMKNELIRLLNIPNLSKDVYEIVSKSLIEA